MTGIRFCSGAYNSFGLAVTIVKVHRLGRSGMARSKTAAEVRRFWRSARLHGKRSHPLAIGVHPVSHALCAIEPKRAGRISVDAGIMAQVPVLARMRALP